MHIIKCRPNWYSGRRNWHRLPSEVSCDWELDIGWCGVLAARNQRQEAAHCVAVRQREANLARELKSRQQQPLTECTWAVNDQQVLVFFPSRWVLVLAVWSVDWQLSQCELHALLCHLAPPTKCQFGRIHTGVHCARGSASHNCLHSFTRRSS